MDIGWPDDKIISDTTPLLQRSATDNTEPIETQWEIDDDPTFGNGNGRKQTKAWSEDETFTPTALAVTGTWYFRVQCRDDTASTNTSSWVSGSFTLTTPIMPHSIKVGGTTVHPLVITGVEMALHHNIVEYEADGEFEPGGANIVELAARKAVRLRLQCVDGDPYTVYNQLLTWAHGKTEVDVVDVGGSDVGFGGVSESYTPSGWKIVSIVPMNKPKKFGLLWYEVVLEEV